MRLGIKDDHVEAHVIGVAQCAHTVRSESARKVIGKKPGFLLPKKKEGRRLIETALRADQFGNGDRVPDFILRCFGSRLLRLLSGSLLVFEFFLDFGFSFHIFDGCFESVGCFQACLSMSRASQECRRVGY